MIKEQEKLNERIDLYMSKGMSYAAAYNEAKYDFPAEFAIANAEPAKSVLLNADDLKQRFERSKTAASSFLIKVNQHCHKTGDSFPVAWDKCLKTFSVLANDMKLNLPEGVEISKRGELVNVGTATPEELGKLKLSLAAPLPVVNIFRALARMKPSNDMAIIMLAGLIRKEASTSETEAYESAKNFLGETFPELKPFLNIYG